MSESKRLFSIEYFFDPIEDIKYFYSEDEAYKFGCTVIIDRFNKGIFLTEDYSLVEEFASYISNEEYKKALLIFSNKCSGEGTQIRVEEVFVSEIIETTFEETISKFIKEKNGKLIRTRKFFESWLTFYKDGSTAQNRGLYSEKFSEKAYKKIIEDAERFSPELAKHISNFKYESYGNEIKVGFFIPEHAITTVLDKIFVNNKG